LANKSKQICIYIEEEEYNHILGDAKAFRQYLDGMIAQYPELFPVMIRQGYTFHDILPESKKLPGIGLRRIKVKANDGSGDEVFTIRPSFVMPYMVGYTGDVEKPLFLRRWGAIVSDHRKQQNQKNRLHTAGKTRTSPNTSKTTKIGGGILTRETTDSGIDDAISTVVSVVLLLGLLVCVTAFINVYYVPSWVRDDEARHNRNVFADFS